MQNRVKEMFYHGYNRCNVDMPAVLSVCRCCCLTHALILGSYLKHAFPHDELKPLSAGYTDSLAELGNTNRKDGSTYKGPLSRIAQPILANVFDFCCAGVAM